jgi:hypothetical protein
MNSQRMWKIFSRFLTLLHAKTDIVFVTLHLASVQIWKWEAVTQDFPVRDYSYLPSFQQTFCSNKQESQIGLQNIL